MKHVGAVLPHVLNFGGVKRFCELGNIFVERGFDCTLFVEHLNGAKWLSYPDWFGEFQGKIEPWDHIKADVILIGDGPSLKVLPEVEGRVFIWVIAGDQYLRQYQAVYGEYPFLVNNRAFLEWFPAAHVVEGGVNTTHFCRRKQLRVGYYSGRGRIKGEDKIQQELGDLPGLTLIPISGNTNEEMPHIYAQLDYFVSNERRLGWANMVAEALACHCPVVACGENTQPFEGLVIRPDDLRGFFESPMEAFDWSNTATKLLSIFKEAA